MVENVLSKLANCEPIINKLIYTGLDSFRLTTEIQREFRTDVDKDSQTENQNDVHEENLNGYENSLLLENSILPLNIVTLSSISSHQVQVV